MSEIIVKVRDVATEMDCQMEGLTIYLNRRTGEFVPISEEEMEMAESEEATEDLLDWQEEDVARAREVLNSDDWIPLPDRFDTNEWDMMRRFCFTVEDEAKARELMDAIQGRGAFRYFRDRVRKLGLEDAWWEYRQAGFDEIALDWLKEHGIAHDRGGGGSGRGECGDGGDTGQGGGSNQSGNSNDSSPGPGPRV